MGKKRASKAASSKKPSIAKPHGPSSQPKRPVTPHEHAESLVEYSDALIDSNEADTRHQIIDCILHDVLSWPRSSIKCESFIDPGYADYILLGRHDRQLLFIEAKRVGHYFSLPPRFALKSHHRYIALKTILSDASIADAINQVREYCLNSGCEYAAVTNGTQWIIFKTFTRNRDWRTLQALVIDDIKFFSESFTRAVSLMSFTAITEAASLSMLFDDAQSPRRARFLPKEKDVAYDHEVLANHLAPTMRPIVERYFGRMNARDSEFMDNCYVSSREYEVSATNVTQLIHDSLSPYFRGYNIKDFFDSKDGGAFGARISSSARERRTSDVIVLFGGKGSGKSTFIQKLLYHRPPQSIKYFAHPAIIDLLECSEDKDRIQDET